MADNDIPAVTGSVSFEDSPKIEISESQDGEEGPESEDDLDEEILLAKEMARVIAENPNLTPMELKDVQEKSKQQVAETVASKKRKKKGVKKIKSTIKAGVKAVTGRRDRTSSQSSTPGTSPAANRSPKNLAIKTIADNKIPAVASPGGSGVAVAPRVAQFVEGQQGVANTVKAAGKGVVTGAATAVAAGAARAVSASTISSGVSVGGVSASADSSIRLTGILWKRRAGLGKYSTSAAWERRRVVLEGTKLLYYKASQDAKNVQESDDASLDEFSQEFETAAEAAAASTSWLGGSKSGKIQARGHFDVLKDQATVAASYGHTGAPTPFALSIKVLGQTKWKLCYDTHEELMQWLAALTDIVVQGSVDAYNGLILEAYDPRNTGGSAAAASANMYGQLSEPPRNLSPQYTDTQEDVGGHRLWSTGHYNVRSLNFPDATFQEMGDILEDVESDDDEDIQVAEAGRHLAGEDVITNQSSSKEFWGIPAQQLLPAVVVLNLALCFARASTVSADMFWHLITFINIALLGVLSKVGVEAVVVSKSDKKLMRRLSSGLGKASVVDGGDAALKSKPNKQELAIPEPRDDFKPVAGTTTIQIENATDLPLKDGIIFGGWRTADPTSMMIRSLGYKKHKKKCASPGELYECIHLDIFESKTRYPDMASRVTLPSVEYPDKTTKTWNAPDLFVISIAIPTDPPKLYGSSDNGGGYTITMYYKMRQETRDILRRVTADGYKHENEKQDGDENLSKVNAVRLLDEWCRRAPTDDNFMARFKVVPNAQNLKEIGLPSWISKYNGKPFLIKRPGETGFLYRHPEKSCIEFDISLHPFPYLAKQGICYMKDTFFKKVLVTFGFLIEGRSDDELPECLIGLFQLCYPDPQHAIQGEDFFAGTSAKSF